MTAIGELHAPACRIDRGDPCAQLQVDVVLSVEFRRPEGVRRIGRGAGEITFRQVGPIARQRLVGAQHRYVAGMALLTKRFGRCVAGRAPTHDDDRFRQVNLWRLLLTLPRLQLFPNENRTDRLIDGRELARHVAHRFDAPAGNRV